jgi:hypothetical protein
VSTSRHLIMSNQKKTFFLCPTWDYHPDGPIQLGNIILSPSTPAEALNNPESLPPTQDTLFPPTTKTSVTWSKEKLQSGRYGLWTEFLSFITGLGVDVSVSHDSSSDLIGLDPYWSSGWSEAGIGGGSIDFIRGLEWI